MSDYNTPTLTTAYATALPDLKDRDVDAITLCLATPSNPPTGAIRWHRSNFKFQEWSGAAFVDVILSVAGGGTGGATQANARTGLGLGTMAVQNSNAVTITGGTAIVDLTGSINYDGNDLVGGPIPQSVLGSGSGGAGTKVLYDDQTYKTIPANVPTMGASQSADFTAALDTVYPLTGSHTVSLPTVTGNAGKRVYLVNMGTGGWTVDPNGSETINGAVTFDFSYGQYSSITLVADANASAWYIL